jgi:hypothetical protein
MAGRTSSPSKAHCDDSSAARNEAMKIDHVTPTNGCEVRSPHFDIQPKLRAGVVGPTVAGKAAVRH